MRDLNSRPTVYKLSGAYCAPPCEGLLHRIEGSENPFTARVLQIIPGLSCGASIVVIQFGAQTQSNSARRAAGTQGPERGAH
jgi:hypothetical protein